jgi:hypothetical protein
VRPARFLGPLLLPVVLLIGCGKELPTASGGAQGFERVVLAELFTAVWCSNCPQAEAALDRLYEEESATGEGGTSRLAVLHWHPSYGPGDPYAIPAADERMEDYPAIFGEQVALPTCIFNGASAIATGTEATYGEYRQQFGTYAALLASVRLVLSVEDDGDHIHPAVQVVRYPGASLGQVEIHAVLAENQVVNTSGIGPERLSFVARAAETQEVDLSGGEPGLALFTLPVFPAWARRNLHVIVFAQEAAPSPGRDYREVMQAVMRPLAVGAPYGFVLSAPQTTVGVPAGGTRRIPFSVASTGTMDDTLAVDLPLDLREVPEGWTVRLTDAGGAPSELPWFVALPAGGVAGDLRLQVDAPSPGTGSVAVTVVSRGTPARADTLAFALTAGTFDLALAAPATEIDVTADLPCTAPFSLTNLGGVPDSIRLELPPDLNHLPAGWEVALADADGAPLGATPTFWLAPSGALDLGLRILADEEGAGTVGLVARSQGDPALADTLTFSVEARAYNLQLRAPASEIWAIVGEPRMAPFEIRNTGARDDLVRLDLPAGLQSLPPGWEIDLGYGDGLVVETPYWLPLEAGDTVRRFGLRIRADAAGQGIARLVATSAGDPSLADTLAFAISADAYGFTLEAPGGAELQFEPGAPAVIPVSLRNIGTLRDTLRVEMPAAAQAIPEGWTVRLTDAGTPLGLPLDLALDAGAGPETWRIEADAPSEGVARVRLAVTSQARPALTDTLRLTLTAARSDYAFSLTAADTWIRIPEVPRPPRVGIAPFELRSAGAFDDTIDLTTSWVYQPEEWATVTPIICTEDGICFGPTYPAEITAGATIEDLVVDLIVPKDAVATGTVRLTATSRGDPTQTHSLVFTFTTETPRAAASAGAPRHR